MMNWSRNQRRPGRGPVVLSVSLHTLFLIAAWWGGWGEDEPVEYVTYQVELVTQAELDAVESPPIVETPNVQPPEPEPEPEPEIPEPEPDPDPPEEVEPEPEIPEPEPEPPPETRPDTPDQPDIAPPASSEEMAVRMEGLRRDYPEYYNQIVREINRCFRWNGGGSWRAVIRFEIQADGRIADSSIRVYLPSASPAFDIEAYGAVACAGSGRLNPLPPDLPFQALSVQFTFQPA